MTFGRGDLWRRAWAMLALVGVLLVAVQSPACADALESFDQPAASSSADLPGDPCDHPCLGCGPQCAGHCGTYAAWPPAPPLASTPVSLSVAGYDSTASPAPPGQAQEPLIRPPAA